jgi:hypothetical protein
MPYAADPLDEVLDIVLHCPALDAADERHLATLDSHFDIRSVDVRVLGQAFADILADAIIRSLVPSRAMTAMVTSACHWLTGVARIMPRVATTITLAAGYGRIMDVLVTRSVSSSNTCHDVVLLFERRASTGGLVIACSSYA